MAKEQVMKLEDLKPHTEEWLEALGRINPMQAEHTRNIIANAGTPDVCGVCGDTPATDCSVKGSPMRAHLCADCALIQNAM